MTVVSEEPFSHLLISVVIEKLGVTNRADTALFAVRVRQPSAPWSEGIGSLDGLGLGGARHLVEL